MFVHEVYKKIVHLLILVPICICRKFCSRLFLFCTKQKDVFALRNDCQNDCENHVQHHEIISKIKKCKSFIILLTSSKSIIHVKYGRKYLSRYMVSEKNSFHFNFQVMNCVIQKETYFLVKNSSSPFSDLCEKGQVIYSRLTMIKKILKNGSSCSLCNW